VSKPLKAGKTPTDLDLIDAFASGIEEHHHTTVVMQSRDFVVFKIKGHSAWSGVAMPWQYVKTRYVLIRKGEWWMASGGTRREWEGRVSKQLLFKAMSRSELTKGVYMGDMNAPFCQECDVEMNYGEGYDQNELVRYYRCDECGWSEDVQ
jgi:hypothetical protein